jgi:3-phytase
MFLTPDDGNDIYWFDLAESTQTPEITVFGEVDDDLTGVTIYSSKKQDYVFAAQGDVIEVYEIPRKRVGMLQAKGLEDIEVQGLHMHQQATSRYPQGVLAYALEADDFQGFGISSLEGTLRELGIELDPKHDPRHKKNSGKNPIRKECSYNGFLRKSHRSKRCDCFAGTAGPKCQKSTCPDDCSCHGTCVGPNTCQCDKSWGGRYCGFLLVEPKYETEANGPDGDDPAIWISPRDPELSRIVTTTKSDADAGLGVFDLTGKQLQMLPASQPNNVDIIYGFDMGDNRTVDLAYAACRGDNTLW